MKLKYVGKKGSLNSRITKKTLDLRPWKSYYGNRRRE
jgi:hypothetical protein